jgi:hypothetical protein
MKPSPAMLAFALALVTGCTASVPSTSSSSGKKDEPPAGPTTPGGGNNASGPSSSDPGSPGPTPAPTDTGGPAPPPPPASQFACTRAGIAAFADALVASGRKACTGDGVGAVRQDNYACIKPAIDGLAPPHADASYKVITTLLSTNTQYPNLECTYFVQTVTAAVCGSPISPSDVAWTDYPLAYQFINKTVPSFTWTANDGKSMVQAGDIIVYDSSDGGQQDPGHIMIVAQVIDANSFRLAEANELNSDGSPANQETGVVSSTRVATLSNPQAAGWYRLSTP